MTMNSNELEQRLSNMESHRQRQRELLEDLQRQKFAIDQKMTTLFQELDQLDNDIDAAEFQLVQQQQQQQQQSIHIAVKMENNNNSNTKSSCRSIELTPTVGNENSTTTLTNHLTMATQPDEVLTEPQTQFMRDDNDCADSENIHQNYDRRQQQQQQRPEQPTLSSVSGKALLGSLHFKTTETIYRKSPLLTTTTTNEAVSSGTRNHTNQHHRKSGTIDSFYGHNHSSEPQNGQSVQISPPSFNAIDKNAPATMNCPPYPNTNQQYPWSREMIKLLHETFRIPSFRDHQKDIIDNTMQGKDVFVIMRTGTWDRWSLLYIDIYVKCLCLG